MAGLEERLVQLWRWITGHKGVSARQRVDIVIVFVLLATAGFIYIRGSIMVPDQDGRPMNTDRPAVNSVGHREDIDVPVVKTACRDDSESIKDNDLQALLDSMTTDAGGHYAMVVKSFADCRSASVFGDEVYPSASLYKLFVMYAAFAEKEAGSLDFNETLVVTEDSLVEQEDTLVLEAGDELSVAEAVQAMVEISDNASATLLLDRIGADRVQDLIDQLGLTDTCVQCSEMGWLTTPNDIARFFEMLVENKAVDASTDQEMLGLLVQQQINNRIPALLPEGTLVAHKTGDLSDVRHDAGIVYGPNGAYIIVVMSDDLMEPAFANDRIAQMSRAVFDYFAEHSSS
jgi:beta-lactamase class A